MNVAWFMPANLEPILVPSPLAPWHMLQLVTAALPATASPAADAVAANPMGPTLPDSNATNSRRFMVRILSRRVDCRRDERANDGGHYYAASVWSASSAS